MPRCCPGREGGKPETKREQCERDKERERAEERKEGAQRYRDTDTVRDADEDAETEVDSETKSLRQRHSEHGGESKAGASTLTLVLALK